MQRDPKAEALDGLADRIMHRLDAGAGFARGFQHTGANLLDIADIFRDRKHRQQPVAHELQDFAAMRPDRRHLAVEIIVENIDHGFGRQPVRQRGKAAQIRQPDRGMHGLGMAAANLAAENTLAGAVADISVEQRSPRCGAG